jgi:hypothetical protein
MLSMIDFGGDAQYAQAFRAVTCAIAASGAKDLFEDLRIDGELVEDALALPGGLRRARIVP